MPIAFSSPSPLLCATNPTSGNTTSLGIGGNIVSRNAAANTAGYPYCAIRDDIESSIPSMNPIDASTTISRPATCIAISINLHHIFYVRHIAKSASYQPPAPHGSCAGVPRAQDDKAVVIPHCHGDKCPKHDIYAICRIIHLMLYVRLLANETVT